MIRMGIFAVDLKISEDIKNNINININVDIKEEIRRGTLYLVSTPIGNLSDITLRAVYILSGVDLIAAEDTRVTRKLLHYFNINKPLVSYYEHNKTESGENLIRQLRSGKCIALVSDAGTPGISDPGEDIVRQCVENDISIVPVPWATAMASALIVSGMQTQRFVFEGFIPVNRNGRAEKLEKLRREERTMIFYEAPHKLLKTLKDMAINFGNRNIVLARELTKKHEEIIRTTVSEAIRRCEEIPPKGEYVLILEGNAKNENAGENDFTDEEIINIFNELKDICNDPKEAMKITAGKVNKPKREIYDLVLKNKNEGK